MSMDSMQVVDVDMRGRSRRDANQPPNRSLSLDSYEGRHNHDVGGLSSERNDATHKRERETQAKRHHDANNNQTGYPGLNR